MLSDLTTLLIDLRWEAVLIEGLTVMWTTTNRPVGAKTLSYTQFFEKDNDICRVMLKKVSFSIFRIILGSKEDENFTRL